MFRAFVLLVGCLASLWAVSSQAQEAALGQLYGKGVHEYFAGDYANASQRMTSLITAGSRDPRVFYFRGLACMKLGQTQEAKTAFSKGAQLESKDINKYYDVARSLERVQGSERQLLESYRVKARIAAFAESERLRKVRYEAIKREEARVVQSMVVESAAPKAKQASETVATPPAGSDSAETAAVEKPAAEEKSAVEDPFAPAAEEKPASQSKPNE
jgi:hypothetical protein